MDKRKLAPRLILLLLYASSAQAELRQWVIDSEKSRVVFTATQNSAPVEGEFRDIRGEVAFDDENPGVGSIRVAIPLASIHTAYAEVAETLKGVEWFDVARFPQATFTSKGFKRLNDQRYAAFGELTIRGKTLPFTLTFVLSEYTDQRAVAKAEAVIMRNAYGVGQGAWQQVDTVRNEVNLHLTIVAVRK